MAEHKKGILDTISGLFGGQQDSEAAEHSGDATQNVLSGLGSMLSGSGIGKEALGKLDGLKSLDTTQIQTVLSALGQSADPQVKEAKQDLETSQHDGETFVQKLKGYATSLSQFLPALLPALQKIFSGQK